MLLARTMPSRCLNHTQKRKVVLIVRDVDKWLASMETSYYDILGWKSLQMLAAIEAVCDPIMFARFYYYCLVFRAEIDTHPAKTKALQASHSGIDLALLIL